MFKTNQFYDLYKVDHLIISELASSPNAKETKIFLRIKIDFIY